MKRSKGAEELHSMTMDTLLNELDLIVQQLAHEDDEEWAKRSKNKDAFRRIKHELAVRTADIDKKNARGAGRKADEEKRKLIVRYREQGMTVAQIAKRLGCTRQNIYRILDREK